jgi:hypothetical protein
VLAYIATFFFSVQIFVRFERLLDRRAELFEIDIAAAGDLRRRLDLHCALSFEKVR